jgi:hypothetical protein
VFNTCQRQNSFTYNDCSSRVGLDLLAAADFLVIRVFLLATGSLLHHTEKLPKFEIIRPLTVSCGQVLQVAKPDVTGFTAYQTTYTANEFVCGKDSNQNSITGSESRAQQDYSEKN